MGLIKKPEHGLHIPLAVFQGMVLERIGRQFPEGLQWQEPMVAPQGGCKGTSLRR